MLSPFVRTTRFSTIVSHLRAHKLHILPWGSHPTHFVPGSARPRRQLLCGQIRFPFPFSVHALTKTSLPFSSAGSYSVPVVSAYVVPDGFSGPGAGFLPEYY
jgi:hypothetical protein